MPIRTDHPAVVAVTVIALLSGAAWLVLQGPTWTALTAVLAPLVLLNAVEGLA
jgi:hypothetical protein